jgi:hypothetical protein
VFDEVLDAEDSASALARGLALGLRLDQLKGIADSFHERYDLLERPFPTLGIPDKRAVQGMVDSRSEIYSLISLAHNEDDLLAVHARKVVGFSERLESIGSDSDMALATLSRFGRLRLSRGRTADWDDDPETGKNACTALKAVLSDIEALRTNELDAVRASVICELSEKIRELAKGYASERVHAGSLEFQDLLVLAWTLSEAYPLANSRIFSESSQITDARTASSSFVRSASMSLRTAFNAVQAFLPVSGSSSQSAVLPLLNLRRPKRDKVASAISLSEPILSNLSENPTTFRA